MTEGNPETVQMDSGSVSKDFDNETTLKESGEETKKLVQSNSSGEVSGSESVVETKPPLSTNGIECQLVEIDSDTEDGKLASETHSDEPKENTVNKELENDSKNCFPSDETNNEVISCSDSSQNVTDSNVRDSKDKCTNDLSETDASVKGSSEESVTDENKIALTQNNVDKENENEGVREQSSSSDLNEKNEISKISSPPKEKETEIKINTDTEIQTLDTKIDDVTNLNNSETNKEKSDTNEIILLEDDDDNDADNNKNSKESEKVPKSSPIYVDSETCTENIKNSKDSEEVAKSSPIYVDLETCTENIKNLKESEVPKSSPIYVDSEMCTENIKNLKEFEEVPKSSPIYVDSEMCTENIKNLKESEEVPKSSPIYVDSEMCTENIKSSKESEEVPKSSPIYVDSEMCTENIKNSKESEEGPKSSPIYVDSEMCTEENHPEEDNKSDDTSQKEKTKVSEMEVILVDIDNDSQDVQNKNNCVQGNNDQSNVNSSNTSGEQDEEESAIRSENDGNEMMDTEVVNCNEIEQIDLCESDSQKEKEIDRIRIEPNEGDLRSDQKDEEMATDLLDTTGEKVDESEERSEALNNVISIDDEAHNQPGNSEEETITGDTSSQNTNSGSKNKDEEVCIIPDNMTPRVPPQSNNEENKSDEGKNEESSRIRIVRVTSLELEASKDEGESKKDESNDSVKSRPVRSAAKLAGNKIKNLVRNDLNYEEQNNKKEKGIKENVNETARMCAQCREEKVCKYVTAHNNTTHYLCSDQCCSAYVNNKIQTDGEIAEVDPVTGEYLRKCGECRSKILDDDKCLFWETMDFCNEDCLGQYQTKTGSNCTNCRGNVLSTSLGKYCVRFGYDIKQFCCSACLEEYKKGLKVCSYCQKDISTGAEGFLAPVGDKGQFKDFCTQSCMEKYERMSNNAPPPEIVEECAVCSNSKPVRVEVELENKTHKLCSEPCFAAFKFVNNITEGQCVMCKKYYDRLKVSKFLLFYENAAQTFCGKTCMNVYILANRKVVPCTWCKVKKYNFDMIKKICGGQPIMMCSLHCLMLYQVSANSGGSRRVKCDFCMTTSQPQYHLSMSDGTIRNFCSSNCVMAFQNRFSKQTLDLMSESEQSLATPFPTSGPKRTMQTQSPCVPVISSVQSLASPNGPTGPTSPPGRVQIPRQDVVNQASLSQSMPPPAAPVPAPPPPQIYQQIITKPPPAKQMKNKSILCKPYSHTKGVSCRPHPCMKETQTDQSLNRKFLIPIPVPIYVPAPMHMFATPFPVPVPFPLPVPVPIFIPTTRNSAKGIFKEIKKIQEKIPTDPFEAELLMMAEMVAGDKKQDPTDSESEDGNDADDGGDGTFSPENVDTSNTFGEDMLQMALKMASELEEPAVDMESVLTSNTITTTTPAPVDPNKGHYASDPDDPDQVMSMNRNRKRSVRGPRTSTGVTPSKRGRRTSGYIEVPLLPPPETVPPPRIEVEKPDANMCLKYTFGVNAWRHWVMQKNAELEKAALTNRKIKLFKPELLQLTADELNFSLCLFVKEVRKPNGTEYAPDTIYYLCLGIQQYLFENGRIDNIFTDSYYEKFTDCLDEVAKKFAALYNDSQYIVTRVEEEHLWESKQLGAHSPHVLLSTLMFFNTKHFNLVTVEEHMQLSFSHIMKHWKRNPNTPGVAKVPGSRNVLLRFYPPQSALEANSRKKKVYEQQENEENPLRCPVKLYEFYLSKCPESVKTRNDVFYLLPERSCVPDSPVWYSTMALGKEPLMKMLHRVKMVKEINIALLSS